MEVLTENWETSIFQRKSFSERAWMGEGEWGGGMGRGNGGRMKFTPIFLLHNSSCLVKIGLHTQNWLHRLPGGVSKLCVSGFL